MTNNYTVDQFRDDLQHPYAWPGGYPRYFITADGGVLCFRSAKANARRIAQAIADDDRSGGWQVIACDINWEDADLFCDDTNERIESAYGDNDD